MEKEFVKFNDLVSNSIGGKILFATDDFFAQAENLLSHEEPVFKDGLFTEFGKWMDGWETRRKRCSGHDWCIIKLGLPGVIRFIHVDTAFFTGNYTPKFSIQAAKLTLADEFLMPKREKNMMGRAAAKEAIETVNGIPVKWTELVPMSQLRSGVEETRHNYFKIDSHVAWTHLRLNMFPDGGIARLRVFGDIFLNGDSRPGKVIDLMARNNGGNCVDFSNAHYGHPNNLIKPELGLNMGDGWETARRLDRPEILEEDSNGILKVPGKEWAIFELGSKGTVAVVHVDTKHFKGNYPDSIKVEGALLKSDSSTGSLQNCIWKTVVPISKLSADSVHVYGDCIEERGPFSHLKVTIAPDGGVSRIRVYGKV